MKVLALLGIFLLISVATYSQKANCQELISYVYEKGRDIGTIKENEIINSSWLKKIEGFSVDNATVVIAEIFTDKTHTTTKKYIFCGIPSNNWSTFYYGRMSIGKSLGEKFHQYIMDYKCNCE